ncbi:MAG: V/A-type H+/Na+-transporting ATPase subunit [Methanofollis sp.]|nr:V/A-type H+/Na+-transporting ATPase subunit [Methanofollis sp.]
MTTLEEIADAVLSGADGTTLLVTGLVIATMMAVLIALSAGYFRTILNVALFARPDARVRAIGNPLISREGVKEALEAGDLHDLFERFAALGHRMPIGTGLDGREAERLIRMHHYEAVMYLIESVPDGVRHFFTAYAGMLGAGEAAGIVAAKARGLSPAAIEERTVPIGALTPERLRKAAHAGSEEEAIRRMEKARFGPSLARAHAGAGGDTASFLAFSLAAALGDMGTAARGVDVSLSPPVVEIAGRMVDAANLRALIRARAFGTGREAAARHLIREGGFELTGERLLRAERTGNLPDLIAAVEGTRYQQYLAAVPGAAVQDRDAAALESALDRCILDSAREIASQYHLESGPLLRHLVALDYEARNMRAIAVGVAAGVPVEEIERILIVEETEI